MKTNKTKKKRLDKELEVPGCCAKEKQRYCNETEKVITGPIKVTKVSWSR